MNDQTPQQILDTPMSPGNGPGATTIRDYLAGLAAAVWQEGEDFSGKRPFGNSGWQGEVYGALAAAGHIADADEWGAGDDLIAAALGALAEPAPPAEPEPATDTQAERMADAYDLGIKAEALRDFADQLDADLPPARPLPPHVIATLARERAEDLDAEAEELATAAEPTPPADALAMPTGVHYTTWLDQITPTLVALGWTPPPGPADSPDERRDRIAAAIRQAAERCECDGSCVCGLGIDCYLGSRTDVIVVGKPSVIAAAVLSAGSAPAPAPPAELTEAQHVTVRRDDLDAVLTHIKYCAENDGDVPYGEVLSRLWAALAPGEPTTELTEAQRHAERIILSHTEDIEFGSIGEMLDDEYERLGQDAGDRLRDEVDRLITDATVTVSWPERAEDGA